MIIYRMHSGGIVDSPGRGCVHCQEEHISGGQIRGGQSRQTRPRQGDLATHPLTAHSTPSPG